MKKITIGVIAVLVLCQFVMADEASDKITRITLIASDRIQYESAFLDNPPRLIIKLKEPGIYGKLIEDADINYGAVKKVRVTYYPSDTTSADLRRVKFLTFWLNQGAAYKIRNEGNRVILDFENPPIETEPKEIEISGAVRMKDDVSKYNAADVLLYRFENAAAHQSTGVDNRPDILWVLVFLLTAVYIMWFRPEAWKGLIHRLVNPNTPPYPREENRRWWRHNLRPLKKGDIYIKVNSPEADTEVKTVPKDLGYGGLSFEHSRLKRLTGKLDIRLFTPVTILPLEVKGDIVWQRNSWNPFRRRVGISFVDLPERKWADIHHYIESQYAALEQSEP